MEPLAKALGLEIDRRFKADDVRSLANELRTKEHGKTILVCWHHGSMSELLLELGANPAKLLPNGAWPDDAFDWMLELRFDPDGRLIPKQSHRIKERLAE